MGLLRLDVGRQRKRDRKMGAEKYRRNVALNCPTCGGTDFEIPDDESQPVKCVRCGRQTSRDELIRENSENISENVEEVKTEVLKDLQKELILVAFQFSAGKAL
jgi:hypothetical protein